jgi:hypothetical protein
MSTQVGSLPLNRPGNDNQIKVARAGHSNLEVTVMRDLSILLAVAVVLILVFQTQRKHR